MPPGTSLESRELIASAVDGWMAAHNLPRPPLTFEGAGGSKLVTRNYVGVVEAGDTVIEIYPKLDKSLIQNGAITQPPTAVMKNLLWMMDVASHDQQFETDTAPLEESPTSFFELFALLLGRNLLRELKLGTARKYVPFSDDLRTVRGRIDIRAQITKNWNRLDLIRCGWDELTPDIPIFRILKAACGFLRVRVNNRTTLALMDDCAGILDEVSDVLPSAAVIESRNVHFDRSTERFRLCYGLAIRLLQSAAFGLAASRSDTFVFLIDMNQLFEDYVAALLRAKYRVSVETQRHVGDLLERSSGGIRQLADYYWTYEGEIWIGDAKYKHLAKGMVAPLSFDKVSTEDDDGGDQVSAAGLLSPADIRQLTVYAELARRKHPGASPNLMLLYPYIGEGAAMAEARAWNGSRLFLAPVQVSQLTNIGDAIPTESARINRSIEITSEAALPSVA